MSKPTAFSFTDIKAPKSGVLVVLAGEGLTLPPTARKLDEQSGGAVARAAKISDFKGKKTTVLDLLVPADLGLGRLLVFGLGKADEMSENDWRALGGAIRSRLSGRQSDQAVVIVEGPGGARSKVTGENAAELAYGALLRGYKFDKYKTQKGKKKEQNEQANNDLKKITVQCRDVPAARKAFATRRAVAAGVVMARDLTNEPANILGPVEFADRLKALRTLGVAVQVLDDRRLKTLGMQALLAVGQGSARPSRVAVMQWKGASQRAAPVAIVGKGVCFDTGGISIKPAAGMEDMKGDMAGASCVAGLMHALAARKARVNAVGIVGLVENMPSGTAQRPGDVVTAMSGQTIEVINTDAEGRLVLADTLWYAQEKYKPAAVINLATLTGAVIVALGKEHAGLFSNDDELADRLLAAGRSTGEKVWRLPLDPKYDKLIDSDIADMKNVGGRWAGSVSAAQFLQRFIKDGVAWAHLDIAGTGMAAPKTDINTSWGSGFGVMLLDRLIADHYER